MIFGTKNNCISETIPSWRTNRVSKSIHWLHTFDFCPIRRHLSIPTTLAGGRVAFCKLARLFRRGLHISSYFPPCYKIWQNKGEITTSTSKNHIVYQSNGENTLRKCFIFWRCFIPRIGQHCLEFREIMFDQRRRKLSSRSYTITGKTLSHVVPLR